MHDNQTILFDLDGTLTDPKTGITNSVRYSLEKLDYPVPDDTVLDRFIGPPLGESYHRFCGIPMEDCSRAIDVYREYFSGRGLLENEVYPGIPDLIGHLAEKGLRLAVATSKPTVFARRILEHFGLADLFEFIGGSNLDNTRVKKAEVITYVLENMGLEPSSGIVMVGDREHDIIGARTVGLPSIGVLYGYGSREELLRANATEIAPDIEALGRLLSK